jgi:hypothetical protein
MSEPGQDSYGEPLPAGEIVIRLGVPSMDFAERRKASPNWFELSTEDKKQKPPRLSVFCERLTTPQQAWELQGSREEYAAMARLNVDTIRAIRPDPNSVDVPSLDVVWDGLDDPRPGADGHAGITGLDRVGPVHKLHTRSFRFQLAEQAVASFLHEDV